MIKRFFSYVVSVIKDANRDLSERVFVIFSIISVLAVTIALVGDIIFRESLGEIVTLIGIVILVPIITFVSLYKERLKFAIGLIVTTLVFIILPALFFFGGGLEGGGVIWFVFAFLYVGLVLSGKWRAITLMMITVLAAGCYAAAYYHPEWIWPHSREMYFIDSFISLILVGLVCFYMTWSQNEIFKGENKRAKKAAELAEELTRSQNRFFSSMSHEIRTPINSILGLNELILRDPTISNEIVRDATGIQGSGKMLLALINDILDFSKIEAGSMDIVPVDYNVGNMLSEVVNMIWIKAHDKGIGFEVSIDPKVPSVLFGDEVRIKQIMINILNNAVKYTKEGSVELHMESENVDEKTTILTISISDTGMGIKKEALPYLFDAFKRVDEEKNRHIEGTGLGLSIVKQLTELMGGTVTVNSVYGEGSTFTVTLKQGISDASEIGELNIHNQQSVRRTHYESSFKAPEAKILIVDDNEMNLEVEKKLLKNTQMAVDTAISGRQALEMTVKTHYDTILMDHLMPEIDGIECLEQIRTQTGGLNRTTPIIVLTANAGSANRELYQRSGFDGYLVKPVSGVALEDILMKHISGDKLIVSDKMLRMREDINTAAGYARKVPVIITSTSMCDLPDAVVKKEGIPILPFLIRTEDGVFKDGVQMDAGELVRYISSGKDAQSAPPDVKGYTEFFAHALKKAHHLIHISLTTSMSADYRISSEAAKSFENVTIVNSECLSSATGILVLIAYKLAQQNTPVDEIVKELETVKKRLRCGFVINTTEYMAKRKLISQWVHRIASALNLHPSLRFKDDRSGVGRIWMGDTKRVYRKYIHEAFPVDIIPDSDVVFITYADVPVETLLWIKEEISKIAYFEHVVFQQASAAISSNCGPGTIGILYFVKSNKSYNIGSYIGEEDTEQTEDEQETELSLEERESEDNDLTEESSAEQVSLQEHGDTDSQTGGSEEEIPWYRQFDFIDGDTAVRNSGSEDAFKAVLKIFYDSIADKTSELEGYYSSKDWANYTIKIHALKSSAKLIGATELSEKAQLLENAGKEGDTVYIEANYAPFMKDYAELGEKLAEYFNGGSEKEEKPLADEYLMESVYEGLQEAAENMDCDMIGEILKELEPYAIPDSEKEKYEAILAKVKSYDYDGILEILGKDKPEG